MELLTDAGGLSTNQTAEQFMEHVAQIRPNCLMNRRHLVQQKGVFPPQPQEVHSEASAEPWSEHRTLGTSATIEISALVTPGALTYSGQQVNRWGRLSTSVYGQVRRGILTVIQEGARAQNAV